MNNLEDVAQDFISLFDDLKIPYAIMGGLAVRIHAIPRPTYDVDFTISLPRQKLPDLFVAAEEKGYILPEAQKTGWIESVQGLSVIKFQWYIHERSIDVDSFFRKPVINKKCWQDASDMPLNIGKAGLSVRKIWCCLSCWLIDPKIKWM